MIPDKEGGGQLQKQDSSPPPLNSLSRQRAPLTYEPLDRAHIPPLIPPSLTCDLNMKIYCFLANEVKEHFFDPFHRMNQYRYHPDCHEIKYLFVHLVSMMNIDFYCYF